MQVEASFHSRSLRKGPAASSQMSRMLCKRWDWCGWGTTFVWGGEESQKRLGSQGQGEGDLVTYLLLPPLFQTPATVHPPSTHCVDRRRIANHKYYIPHDLSLIWCLSNLTSSRFVIKIFDLVCSFGDVGFVEHMAMRRRDENVLDGGKWVSIWKVGVRIRFEIGRKKV